MTRLLLLVALIGLPVLAMLGDLSHRNLMRSLTVAETALHEAEQNLDPPPAQPGHHMSR